MKMAGTEGKEGEVKEGKEKKESKGRKNQGKEGEVKEGKEKKDGKIRKNQNTQENCSQPVSNDPSNQCGEAAGVLKYNREFFNQKLNLPTTLAESLAESQVKCESCGQKSRPSLDLTWQQAETAPHFCCPHRQQLCELLIKQKRLVESRYHQGSGGMTPEPSTDTLPCKKVEDPNKLMMDLSSMLRIEPEKRKKRIDSELRALEDYTIQLPEVETHALLTKVFSFRLSSTPQEGCWVMTPSITTEETSKFEEHEEEEVVRFCDHKPPQFGICQYTHHHHHDQDGTGFLQKYYSNGVKFLTMFPNGSAQVFYPSGLLAVIVVVSEQNGRVCIVYDETPDQPIRAVFQSDGRGTCYHNNGSIWLTINRSGGQCLDQDGARVRRWTWCDPNSTPSSLRPIFLSINRSIGLRVLKKEQVLVSFLRKGRQAKFSVGASCDQEECKSDTSGPSVLKEELIALAAQIKMRCLLQHLNLYLKSPSRARMPNPTPFPQPKVITQRLLEESKGANMSETEKEFILGCLQFCQDINLNDH